MILTIKEKNNLNLLDQSYRKDLNLIKFHVSNSERHEYVKGIIAYWLLKNKKNFVTEARFKDNLGRADVFNLTDSLVYEIVDTEKDISIELKRGKYPVNLIVIPVDKILYLEDKEDLDKILN